MSHHILHVFQHGAVLGRERGFITCKADGQAERRLPLDDVRAVIIAARGVTISSNFLSGLLETDAIVLHCASPRGVAPGDAFLEQPALLHGASGISPAAGRRRWRGRWI